MAHLFCQFPFNMGSIPSVCLNNASDESENTNKESPDADELYEYVTDHVEAQLQTVLKIIKYTKWKKLSVLHNTNY